MHNSMFMAAATRQTVAQASPHRTAAATAVVATPPPPPVQPSRPPWRSTRRALESADFPKIDNILAGNIHTHANTHAVWCQPAPITLRSEWSADWRPTQRPNAAGPTAAAADVAGGQPRRLSVIRPGLPPDESRLQPQRWLSVVSGSGSHQLIAAGGWGGAACSDLARHTAQAGRHLPQPSNPPCLSRRPPCVASCCCCDATLTLVTKSTKVWERARARGGFAGWVGGWVGPPA